jgi:parvulin-like peptidyl-prolyl isomerase
VPKTIRRSPLVAGVLVLLVVVGVGVAACGDDDTADLPTGVVARVGDAGITQEQLDRAVAQTEAEAKAQGQTVPAEGSEGFDQVRQQALQTLVQQKIVGFEARECGDPCKVTEKQIDEDLDRIIETNFSGKQAEFQKFLKDRGITQADARDIVESGLQQQKLFNHITRGVRFTQADAKKYYEENPAEFKVAAGRTASHILVASEAEAERIRAEATPENFAELARENSIDTGTAKEGGNLGPVQPGQFVPEFEKAATALKDGEISQPVKTQFGWHIITVDVTPASTTSFADAKDQIISTQLQQKRQAEFTTWSEDVLKKWEDRTVYADSDLKPATAAEQPTEGVTTP